MKVINKTGQTLLVDTEDGVYEAHEVPAGKEMDTENDCKAVYLRTEKQRGLNVFTGVWNEPR